MYLIKSLGGAKGPIRPGVDVNWVANQYGIVEDSVIRFYQNDTVAWTVVEGPDINDVFVAMASLPTMQAVMLAQAGVSEIGDGSVPTASGTAGVVATEEGLGLIHRTTFTFTNLVLNMTDATTAGSHGAIQLYDFPAGLINILGAVSDVDIVSDATGLSATASLIAAVGTATAGTDNETLTGTEADLIASTAATLTGSAGAFDGVSTASEGGTFDGTATAKDAFLNFAAPDADSTGDDVMLVSGTIVITWINLGDN